MKSVHSPTLARSRKRWLATSVALATTAAVIAVGGVASAQASIPVGLGTADSFAVLAGQSVTNTGPSVIEGDLGLSPGTTAGTGVSGFPPGLVIEPGTQHVTNAVANQAQSDLTKAYNDAAGRDVTATVTDDLGGQTLTAGTYFSESSMGLTGPEPLFLDAENDPDAVFIFQIGSTLTTASNSRVELINKANPCNVFWQVGSSATLNTNTDFVGTVMAMASISALTGTNVQGRLLARTGSVTLDSNTITAPDCDEPTTTTTSAPPSSEPSDSTTPSTTETTEPDDSTTPTTTETEPSTSVPTTPTTTVTNGIPVIPIPIPIPILPPGGNTPGGPDQPPVVDGQPPVGGGQPPSGPGQPPVEGGQPPAGPGQPPVAEGQPPVIAGQPPVEGGQPPVIAGQPPTGGGYIVPKGYPDTGAGGTAAGSSPLKANALVAALVALTLLGSGIAAGQAFRLNRRLK